MDPQNQIINEQNKCKHTPVITVLVILLVCSCTFCGFELYQNINNQNRNCYTEYEQNDNNIVDNNNNTPSKPAVTGDASFTVPNPTSYSAGINDGTVKFEYGVYNNVLSAYSINYYQNPAKDVISKVISSNLDLNTGEKLDNVKTLDRFGFTIDEVYRKILNNIAETASIDSFLLDINGNVEAEKISINDFKNNTEKYIATLKSDQNLFYVFLKDSKATVSYEQYKILQKLGMSSHMGQGLVNGYVEIQL